MTGINKSVILKSGIKVHDFRPNKLGWGWVGMAWHVHPDGTAGMTGIGSGLKAGDFIALVISGEIDGEITGHKIKSIDYETNPKDMFSAVLSGTYTFEDDELNELNKI